MPKSIFAAFALIVALLAAAAPAAAQQDVEKQIKRMNKKAMEDYDSLEFESARRTLIDAVAMLRSSGLDESPLAARTYANLGIIYIAGFKDRNRGVQQFVAALKIQGTIRLDPSMATPELDEAFGAAMRQAGVSGGTRPPPDKPPVDNPDNPPEKPPEKPPEEVVKGLQHTVIDEAPPRHQLAVKAKVGADLNASKLVLLYRGGGQEDFVTVHMKHGQGAEWTGTIPADAMIGTAMQYYLEVRDARGRTVASAGSAGSPNIISITAGAKPQEGGVAEVDVEDPLLRERQRQKHAEDETKASKVFDRLFIFIMPGLGFGYEPGGNHTEVAWQCQSVDSMDMTKCVKYVQVPVQSPGGFALAPFHLAFELGGLITSRFSLSALVRLQVATGANAQTTPGMGVVGPTTKAGGAFAVLLRARYRFLEGRFHPYLQINAGYGQIRHSLDVSGAESDRFPLIDQTSALTYNQDPTSLVMQEVCMGHRDHCVDTIAIGSFLFGGGVGLWYDIAKHFAIIADLNLIGALGAGGGQNGFNADIQVGVGTHFGSF